MIRQESLTAHSLIFPPDAAKAPLKEFRSWKKYYWTGGDALALLGKKLVPKDIASEVLGLQSFGIYLVSRQDHASYIVA